ncbi:glycosyltransferase [Cytophaga aurantiaca]|uniref:glycosyltransferase n=1 Tax=Cytophaga aurantiaca TaxID=29530 RepID=UPI00037DD38A|nr:glycosyltransferase [Cytophaga aurantiaca]
MKSITLYSTLPTVGGNSTIVLGLAKMYRANNVHVTVIVRYQEAHGGINTRIVEELNKLNCLVYCVGEKGENSFSVSMKALKFILNNKSDIFISIGMGSVASILALLGKFKKTYFYYINHDPTASQVKRLGLGIRAFTGIIVISPASIEPVSKLVNAKQPVLWLPQFSEVKTIVSFSQNTTEQITFGIVGNLLKSKGIIEALKLWKENNFSHHIYFLGDGECKNDIIQAASTDKRIEYKGAFGATNREVVLPDFFNSIDYLLVPSIGHGEGIPTVILESLSLGVPVISTSGGGTIAFGAAPLDSDFNKCVALKSIEEFGGYISQLNKPDVKIKELSRSSYLKWFSDERITKLWMDL